MLLSLGMFFQCFSFFCLLHKLKKTLADLFLQLINCDVDTSPIAVCMRYHSALFLSWSVFFFGNQISEGFWLNDLLYLTYQKKKKI